MRELVISKPNLHAQVRGDFGDRRSLAAEILILLGEPVSLRHERACRVDVFDELDTLGFDLGAPKLDDLLEKRPRFAVNRIKPARPR